MPGTDGQAPQGSAVTRFFDDIGPGLITGAADDDPSGISTYSVAGATFGYAPLWTALFAFPLMAAVQLMCARLGLVSGRGLAGVVRRYYPRWVLWCACGVLVVANVFNIGADLGGMAAATEMVTGVRAAVWTPVYAVLLVTVLVFSSYRLIARVFKWMTLVLFVYVIAAFLAHPDWSAVLRATFIPHIEWSRSFLAMFVGILGTTISPYLFFWQASQEVEVVESRGKHATTTRDRASDEELRAARVDVFTGMLFSGVVMYFIVLTSAATVHAHGSAQIATAQDAAEALRPVAGNAAYLLFTLGIIGTGMLAVPVLAGSAAYAISEAESWRGSLDDRPQMAPRFYLVVTLAMLVGLVLAAAGFDAVKMLFYAAVLNGVLAPPLIVLVTMLSSNREVMGARVNSPLLRWIGWFTATIMTVAAIGMLVTT